jgi:phosphoribosylcarboxyaminoimidazole (NCAIR) mutase
MPGGMSAVSERPVKAAQGNVDSMSASAPLVGVIMGSDSDLPVMQGAIDVLTEFGVAHEVRIVSAHRTPDVMY